MKINVLILLIVSSILVGCASTQSRHRRKSFSPPKLRLIDKEENKSQVEKRIILYQATINLNVKNIDTANSYLKLIAEKNGGYAMSMGNKNTEIRVKAEKLNEAILEIANTGKIKSKNIYGNDVTDEYYDHEIRLDNAKKARQRYLELLAKAENVETTLKVEKELERLNGEIDLLEGKLNRLNHLNEYSTITIYLQERKKLGILGYVTVGLYEGIKWLFVRN
ncbi:MAG: DUF4349 domain-containing protein [Bacteroidia bacterium]